MSTLFLIGNGFDINCGMKTRYCDVYAGYVNEVAATENLKRFKETIFSDIENWGDFEMAMAKYAESLADEAEFLECIRDFAQYMEKYLIEESSRFKQKMAKKQVLEAMTQEVAESLSTFYNGISHNVDIVMEQRGARILGNIEVISFNYTDVFDVILKNHLKNFAIKTPEIIHVHGTLQDGPVLGVDNVEQIRTNFKVTKKGKREFVKPIFNAEFDQQRIRIAMSKIKSANTICVFGMSLGESDLSWRNEIIEWLNSNEGNHLFVYRYNLSEVMYRTVAEKMDIEDDEKERLLVEWGIVNGDSLIDRIHIPCGRNIFNIQKIIEKIENENHEQRIAELKNRIVQGREFVEDNPDMLVV